MNSSRRPSIGRASLHIEGLEDRLTPATLSDQIAAGQIVADHVLVVLRAGASPAPLAAAAVTETTKSLGHGIYLVDLKPGTDLGTAISTLQTLPGVESAEPDRIMQADKRANDPFYATDMYGPTQIDANLAWNVTTGNPAFTVAVLDSGTDHTHRDLAQNIWINQNEIPAAVRAALADVDGDGLITFRDLNHTINQGAGKITDLNRNGYIDGGDLIRTVARNGWSDGTDDDGNGYTDDIIGWDFVNDDNDPQDDDDHGTHVAGTIAAVGNNGVGVTGINWRAQVLPLKFLGPFGGSNSDAILALNYAVSMGVRVSNNSYGYSGPPINAFLTAIEAAQAAGHIFVAAAGNDGEDNDVIPHYPTNFAADADNVISVAATDSSDTLASFSDYGVTTVTLAAPGVQIFSTRPGNQYQYLDGTSMASPHVAGAIALYWSANPALTYDQVIAKLKASVDLVPGLDGKVETGGRLNVANMFDIVPTVLPVAVGAPAGTEVVRVLSPGGATQRVLDPYPGFLGGVASTVGDLTGDKVADVVTAAALGGHVKAFDGNTGALIRSFIAFPGYVGPMSVSIGDLTGDGIGDIIVGANLKGHVKVFDGVSGLLTFSSIVYQGYTGRVSVTTGDTNADGTLELITAADGGSGVHVKTFSGGSMALFDSFMATTGPSQWGTFDISAQDFDGDEVAELLVSQGPRVRVLNPETKKVRADFLAFDPLAQVPVTVQATRYLGLNDPQLIAVAEVGGKSHVKVFKGTDFVLADSFYAGTR